MERIASARLLSVLLATAALAVSSPLHAANGLTVLHSFNGVVDGQYPRGTLLQASDGDFYGTTDQPGGVYKLSPSGDFSVLHSYTGSGDVRFLRTGLVLMNDGNFYGVANNGGMFDAGAIFRMTPDGELTTLHDFESVPLNGSRYPNQLAVGRDGLLYGTSLYGGSRNSGTAYAIATDGTYMQLVEFDRANGSNPNALTAATDGYFYGTSRAGGAYGKGTFFRMTPDGTITTLHSFRGGSEGSTPASLMQGNDGRFYGGTVSDGGGAGTVFAITADGELTTLHAFNGGDGAGSYSVLVQGSDGGLYGASDGGAIGGGVLYRLSTSGQLTLLHQFTGQDGASSPASGLVFGSDGRLYGSTTFGAEFDSGAVYAFDPAARLAPELHMAKKCYYVGKPKDCVSPINIRVGGRVKLIWTATNADACQASGAWNGSRPGAGIFIFRTTQPGSFLYELECTGPNGRAGAQVTLTVI